MFVCMCTDKQQEDHPTLNNISEMVEQQVFSSSALFPEERYIFFIIRQKVFSGV